VNRHVKPGSHPGDAGATALADAGYPPSVWITLCVIGVPAS
jgi:hypothetical protein